MNEIHEGCDIKEESRLYKIGMFAQMNHITIKTLRFYEEQGLIFPAHVDDWTGYRYYTMDQMEVIHQITAMKEAGLKIEEIKMILKGADENVVLQKKKSDVMTQIAKLTKQLAIIDSYMLDKTVTLTNPVVIKTLPAGIVATYKKTINSYDDLFELMPEFGAKMEQLGCECAIPEYCYTSYFDGEYKDSDIKVGLCQTVTVKKKDDLGIEFSDLPEVKAACIFHKGSYANFQKTYSIILKYIEENGLEICGDIRENYIDGVWNKEDEDDWLSEIQIPIK